MSFARTRVSGVTIYMQICYNVNNNYIYSSIKKIYMAQKEYKL